jgi:BirA family biotin operon repressor/biotin-[acetyl-CoA-carboxylase] ligase
MKSSLGQFTAANLQAALAQHSFITDVDYRPQLGSTNDLAKQRASEGAPEGLLVITDEQTGGRGRMGRRWWAPFGSALLMSLLFRPSLAVSGTDGTQDDLSNSGRMHAVQQLNMLCILAIADAITDLTALPVKIKWPNDLIVRGQKLAGLLAESVFKGHHLEAVVVGVGINVNTDFSAAPPFIAPAASVRSELGHSVDRMPLLVAYLDRVAHRYAQLKAGAGPYDEWANRLITLGQQVTAHMGGQTSSGRPAAEGDVPNALSGLAEGVDTDGALLLRTADGTLVRLLAADVSLRHQVIPKVPPQLADA